MSNLPNFANTRHAIPITLLLLLGAALYSNTLNSPFTFDDEPNIQENSHIRITQLNLQSLYRAGFDSRAPRPIAYMSFALNYYLGEYEVRGYHLFNIFVHLISGVLVYWLAIDLFHRRHGKRHRPPDASKGERSVIAAALLAAAIFLAHPIQTQSVTYIVQRMSSMAAMFYLLALLLFIYGRDRRRAKRWALWLGSTACWLLALGCKQTAATFPLIVLLYEWYFYRDLRSHWLRHRLPLLLGGVLVVACVAAVFMSESVFSYDHRNFSLWERLLTQPRVVVQYVGLLLYPHPSRLNLAHDVPVSHSLIDPVTTLFSLVALLALFALAIRQARAFPLFSFCTLWFFIHLAIESSIFPLEMMFEHRLYLPVVGFSLAAASLLHSSAFNKSSWAVAAVIALVAVGALGLGTYARNETWRDELTLWSDAVSKSPEGYRAHNNLGTALRAAGQPTEAAAHLSRSIELNPDYFPPHWNLAAIAKDGGDTDALIVHLRGALALNPKHASAHRQLARALINTGDWSGALEHFEEAVRLGPDWPAALVALAWVLANHPDPNTRAPQRAIELAERADELTEHSKHHILNTLATAYKVAKRFEDAARIQRDLLELELADGGPRVDAIRARLEEFEEFEEKAAAFPDR